MKLTKGYEFTYKTNVKLDEMATGYIEEIHTVFFPATFRIALDLAKNSSMIPALEFFLRASQSFPRQRERKKKRNE